MNLSAVYPSGELHEDVESRQLCPPGAPRPSPKTSRLSVWQASYSLVRIPGDRALGRCARAWCKEVAALIQGTAAHAAEVDDGFRDAMLHLGAATIAAALAAAQSVGANGPEFLRGVVLGYKVSTRVGVAVGRAHYRYCHNTGTMGCFGAAAAAGALLGLDEAAFAHALAMAGTFTAGRSRRSDRMRWPSRGTPAAQQKPGSWQRSWPRAACAARSRSSMSRAVWAGP